MSEFTVICGRRIPVVAQKHARLRHLLSADDFQAILSAQYSHESYRVLGILIPQLPEEIPEWEWDGYASQEAQREGRYDEDQDKSPTFDEIAGAFETALKVNGAGRVGKLLSLIETGLKAQQSAPQTPESPGSPGGNGASHSTSTGASSPTPALSGD